MTLDFALLRREYDKIEAVPFGKVEQFLSIIHSADDAAILRLARENIKFVSRLAVNEITRRGLK